MFKNKDKDFFLNEEEPHLTQTILPPNDLSDTRLELPQYAQILLKLIYDLKIIDFTFKLYSNNLCKEKNQLV